VRILILGKAGQVGWELQHALASQGDVLALGRAEADLEDPGQLRQAVIDAAPDVIVNAAAHTAVDRAESEPERVDRINHLAVAELATFAAGRGAWLVHYSTDYVFDGSKPSPYVETDAANPITVYGRSKLAGERAVLASGAKAVIFRTSWVHAGRGHNFIRTILRLARERETLKVVADQIGAPTSAGLVADVTALAVHAIVDGKPPAAGIYNLTAAGETSWHGLARATIEAALAEGALLKATPQSIVAITTADYPTAAARPANSRLDTTKLRQTFRGLALPDWRVHVRGSVGALIRTGP